MGRGQLLVLYLAISRLSVFMHLKLGAGLDDQKHLLLLLRT